MEPSLSDHSEVCVISHETVLPHCRKYMNIDSKMDRDPDDFDPLILPHCEKGRRFDMGQVEV